MKPLILLIYTGGTIGMVKNSKGVLGPFNFDNLIKQIPQLNNVNAEIKTISIDSPKDSAEMRPNDWQSLAELIFDNYAKYNGFVVLHGTDTMAYTTSALSFMFKNLGKPVIFTGSQLPIGDIRTDALENVLTAIEIAVLQKNNAPLLQEVCLFFGNKLFRGNRVTKISSEAFEAFDSPNYRPLAISNVKLEIEESLLIKDKKGSIQLNNKLSNCVFVYKIHPAITQEQFELVCENLKFNVLIIQSYGSGTIFVESWFINALQKLISKGIYVINTSQCVFGGVDSLYESSMILKKLGVINAKDMTFEAVLTKSMHALAYESEHNTFKTIITTDLRGEID